MTQRQKDEDAAHRRLSILLDAEDEFPRTEFCACNHGRDFHGPGGCQLCKCAEFRLKQVV